MSEIPEKCLNCPAVKGMQEVIEFHEARVTEFIDELMSDNIESQLQVLFEQHPEIAEHESLDEQASRLRRMGSQQLEHFEDMIEMQRKELGRIVLGCTGVLELHGENDQVTVAVNVCVSPANAHDEGFIDDIALIDRQTKE